MSSNAILDAYAIIRYYKNQRDLWGGDAGGDAGGGNVYTYDEINQYNYYCILLDMTRNYLWNISPDYRAMGYEHGEFDSVMAVF